MEIAQERVRALEAEIDALQTQRLAVASTDASTPDGRIQVAAAGAGKAASWWKWW